MPGPGATEMNLAIPWARSVLRHGRERQVNKDANVAGYIYIIDERASYEGVGRHKERNSRLGGCRIWGWTLEDCVEAH